MPRKLEYIRKGYTLMQLKDLYYELGSYSALSEFTSISSRTLIKYIGGRKKGSSSRHTSKLAEWIRHHPHTRLPASPIDISALTDVSLGAVKMYLYRRRIKEYIRACDMTRDILKRDRFIWSKGAVQLPTEGIRKWFIRKKDVFKNPIPVTIFMKGGSIHKAFLDIGKGRFI